MQHLRHFQKYSIYDRTCGIWAISESTWYTPDYRGSQFGHGAANAPWEGIGTGWFYSALGGGEDKRPVLKTKRIEVSEDNTSLTRMQGDFAVPTLFDGNFDAVTYNRTGQVIPGWSLYNGTADGLQKNLVKWEDISSLAQYRTDIGYNPAQTNYALKLGDGLNEITHNRFVVPDWGVLRFNLYTPTLSSGTVTVSLQGEDGTSKTEVIHLEAANGPYNLGYNDNDTYRIGYGNVGFESFYIDLPETLRGKVATLNFQVSGGTVYLDDVFFKSEHLMFGNPTLNGQEARPNAVTNANNYLIERPQYSLSYNNEKQVPNWVSWTLNRTWLGEVTSPEAPWFQPPSNYPGYPNIDKYDYPWKPDSSLPSGLSSPRVSRYRTYNWTPSYDRGHLAAREDRNRNQKDQLATYFITNALPMVSDFNQNGAWRDLERFTGNLVEKKGWELYIMAGGIGSDNKEINPEHPLNRDDVTNTFAPINVPESLWKIIVILEPGQDLADITSNTPIISVIFPNAERPKGQDIPDGVTWYQPEYKYITNIKNIENLTGLTLFSNLHLSEEDINDIKNKEYAGLTRWEDFSNKGINLSANLLSTENTESLETLVMPDSAIKQSRITDVPETTSVGKDIHFNLAQIYPSPISSIEQSQTQIGIVQYGSSQISIDKTSLDQVSSTQIGFTQVGSLQGAFGQFCSSQVSPAQISVVQLGRIQDSFTQISSTQVSSFQISAEKVSSTQIGVTQINFGKVSTDKLNSTQINPTKIPLSSSITLEQLFSIHNPTPTSNNTYKYNPLKGLPRNKITKYKNDNHSEGGKRSSLWLLLFPPFVVNSIWSGIFGRWKC